MCYSQVAAPVVSYDDASGKVLVVWDTGADRTSGITYTVAVLVNDDPPVDIHTGAVRISNSFYLSMFISNFVHAHTGDGGQYEGVGFKEGHRVRFAIKASNYYGSSQYSAPSEPVVIPQVTEMLF